VADTDLDVVERLRILGKQLFAVEADVTAQQGYQEVTLSSVRLARWWEAAGFAKRLPSEGHTGKGWTPHVPAAIRETNDKAVYAAFVRGLFEADGTVANGVPSVSTSSRSFASERPVSSRLALPRQVRDRSGFGGARSSSAGPQPRARVMYARRRLPQRRKAAWCHRRTQTGNRDRCSCPVTRGSSWSRRPRARAGRCCRTSVAPVACPAHRRGLYRETRARARTR
jgi:ribonucleoside-diphosphate reductase alpha chain